MIRTQILLDPGTHDALRRLAFGRRKSVSAIVREILAEALSPAGKGGARYDFGFVGMIGDDPEAVAENHDDYLGEGDRW
ncbi:MAG: ribbon-helix-helix domain-containing protein [Planctomycetes bacterium]|jgi:hypothetical protein|nr:ribbon-helix-helix domain-containing protein [Planctomycetota bacterium]